MRFTALTLTIATGLAAAAPAHADVFINELHYDNANTDLAEKIEVLAPAGTHLSGWSVVLYNGSNGKRYATLPLSGTVANQCNGFGTAVVTAAGMQNGAPDGLALVDANGSVVQLLSYEGTFTASDGPANGRTSTAIPQAETSGTASGTSLQLTGSGSSYADFEWKASRSSSFGSCNSGQTPSGNDGGSNGSVLQNGVPVAGLSAADGKMLTYTLTVPAGAHDLKIESKGGSGDADLYVRFGSAPTTDSYDCRPYLYGNDETCNFANPQAGTWYVMLHAYDAFSGATLEASFTAADTGGGDTGGGDNGGGNGDHEAYYASVDTSSAAALRTSLHAIISNSTKIPYTASSTDTWNALDFADEDPLDAGKILDIYKNTAYPKAGGGNNFYNREHTWPNSYGFSEDGPGNFAYTDLHMLMASDIAYNSARSNKPYGNCNASCIEYPTAAHNGRGGGSGVFPGNSNWTDGTIWQTWNGIKGNVARAVLYMDIRYEGGSNGSTGNDEPDLRLTDDISKIVNTHGNASVAYMGLLSVLLQWNAQDPVDAYERIRNDAVQTYQGNRNPFIDHPEWIACIYQNVCP